MNSLESIKVAVIEYLQSKNISVAENQVCHTEDADISIRFSPASYKFDGNLLKAIKMQEYSLPIADVIFREDILNINLDKAATFNIILMDGHTKRNYIQNNTVQIIYDAQSSMEDLTNYRVSLLAKTVENLSKFVDYTIKENSRGNVLYFSSKSNFSEPLKSNQKLILCGPVLSSTKKIKETTMSVSDLKNFKMSVLLQEMENRERVNEEVALSLADAIIKFDFIRVKLSSPIHLNISKSGNGTSGSAVFILYNYSRLNVILCEYESRVRQSYYPPLPPIEEVDFSLLKEKKEWKLLRDFVLNFPTVILSTVKDVELRKPAPHILCQFLYSLARAVSSYYRSTKILLEKQPQLIMLTFARIYLIKSIHRILEQGLEILSIKTIPAL